MKRFLYKMRSLSSSFLLLMSFLIGNMVSIAQTTVTIGSGTGTGTYIPIYSYYGYSYTQSIYQSSELSAVGLSSGLITKLRFKLSSSVGSNSNDWVVYLGTTSQNSFSSTTDWIASSNLTQVYSGTVTYPAAGNWMEFTFATPYVYTGGNLVVAVEENQPGYGSSGAHWYSYTSTTTNSGIYYYNDSNNPDPASPPTANNRTSTLPQIQLDYNALTPCTGTPEAGVIANAPTTICGGVPLTLTDTGYSYGGGISYQWQQSTGGGAWTDIAGATGASLSIGAGINTPTDFRMYIVCSGSGLSDTTLPVSIAITPANQCYCDVTGGATSYYISNVTANGISGFNNSSSSSVSGYTDFSSSDTVSQVQGGDVTYSVAMGPSGYSYGVGIWVDFNQNGNFTDPGEEVYNSGTYVTSVSGTFGVPLLATPGVTKMRVGVNYLNTSPDPCSPDYYSDYEDYSFNVIELVPCSGQPTAGTINYPDTSVCSGIPFSLVADSATIASGLTYQWQQNTSGTWADITGANTPTLNMSAGITVATYFRMYIVCNISGMSDTTNIQYLSITPANQCYCIPDAGLYGSYYLNDISTTGGLTNLNYTTSTFTPYVNNSAITFSQIQGESINVALSSNTSSNYFLGWVDWNADGDFSDVGEQVFTSGSYVSSYNGVINVPTSQPSGSYRVRFATSYIGSVTECGPANYGNYVDFTLVVPIVENCANVTFPTSVNSISNPTNVCVSGDFTLDLDTAMPLATGVYYQWQTSPTQNGTYTNIGTADTFPEATFTTSSTNWYQCQAICNGNVILTSTPVQVQAVVPTSPTVTDGQHCGPGTVDLSATVPTGLILWYDAPTGGAPLGNGTSFTTPPLNNTDTFYATNSSSMNVGADSLATINTGGNGCSGGVMFDITPTTDLSIDSFKARCYSTQSSVTINVYTKSGTYSGNETNAGAWTLLETFTGVNTQANQMVTLPLSTPLDLTNGTVTGVYINYDASYTTLSSVQNYSNADMNIAAGVGLCGQFSSVNNPRGFNGKVFYHKSGCQSTRVPVIAHIRDIPVVDLGPDSTICGDANQSVALNAGNPGSTYLWDNNTVSQTRTITQSGTYYVTVTSPYGCIGSDTVTKQLLTAPIVQLGNDTNICNGVTLTLDAGDDGVSYYWNNGAVVPTIEVSNSGTYIVIVTNSLNCTVIDTINVTVSGEMPTIDAILINNVGPYTFNFSVFNPQGVIYDYTWDFGDGTPVSHQLSPNHTYASPGNYNVTLTLNTPCGLLHFYTSTHIVGVSDIVIDDAVLNVYPNPAKDNITIENKGDFTMKKISITNVVGQVMNTIDVDNGSRKQVLNISAYANGVYSIKVETDKGNVIRRFEVIR